MSIAGFKKCDNCRSIRGVDDMFCGNCGYQFGGSRRNYPTKLSGEPQQNPTTPVLSDITLPVYTPDPRQPIYTPQPLPRTQSNRKLLIVIAVLLMMLIGAGFFELGQLVKGNPQGAASNTSNTSQNTPINGNSTATNVAPTATPTATPSPTPTPASVVGKVLYETHNFSGWTGTSDWKVLSDTNILVNDATRDHSQPPYGPSIPAPYLVQGTNDYAVEAKIQVSSTNVHNYYPCFGITVCGTPVGTSWQGYYVGVGCYTYLGDSRE